MHRLRNKLIAVFLIATLVPLAATIWISTSLLERSLGYATTEELDRLSRSLEDTVRRFYQRERQALRADALRDASGPPASTSRTSPSGRSRSVRSGTARSGAIRLVPDPEETISTTCDEPTRCPGLPPRSGCDSDAGTFGRVRADTRTRGVDPNARSAARVDADPPVLVALVWLISLAPVVFIAHRISQPIQQLTAGLTDFAAGDWDRHSRPVRTTRSGAPIAAFNTWRSNCDRTGSASSISRRCRAGSRLPARRPMS